MPTRSGLPQNWIDLAVAGLLAAGVFTLSVGCSGDPPQTAEPEPPKSEFERKIEQLEAEVAKAKQRDKELFTLRIEIEEDRQKLLKDFRALGVSAQEALASADPALQRLTKDLLSIVRDDDKVKRKSAGIKERIERIESTIRSARRKLKLDQTLGEEEALGEISEVEFTLADIEDQLDQERSPIQEMQDEALLEAILAEEESGGAADAG